MPHRPPKVTRSSESEHAQGAERSDVENRWLDLIADIIAEQLLNEDARDADPLRDIREV